MSSAPQRHDLQQAPKASAPSNCSAVSSVCEQYIGAHQQRQCGKSVAWLYPARGGSGWMALCDECATPHKGTRVKLLWAIRELLEAGVTFDPPLNADSSDPRKEKL